MVITALTTQLEDLNPVEEIRGYIKIRLQLLNKQSDNYS